MKKTALNYLVSLLLLGSLCLTGALGYIQSELELRRFMPHRYFAYTTMGLAAIHVYLNWTKLWRYFFRKSG